MKAIITLITALCAFPAVTHSATIAVCGEQSGKSYFPYAGMTPSTQAGWHDNGISDGVTTLAYTDAGEFDLLFYDATKAIRSTLGEGGYVSYLHIGDKLASFIVHSSDTSFDVYTFIETDAGIYEMTRTANRMNEEYFPNFSIFTAKCSELDFDALNNILSERDATAAVAAAKEAARAAQEAAEAARSAANRTE